VNVVNIVNVEEGVNKASMPLDSTL